MYKPPFKVVAGRRYVNRGGRTFTLQAMNRTQDKRVTKDYMAVFHDGDGWWYDADGARPWDDFGSYHDIVKELPEELLFDRNSQELDLLLDDLVIQELTEEIEQLKSDLLAQTNDLTDQLYQETTRASRAEARCNLLALQVENFRQSVQALEAKPSFTEVVMKPGCYGVSRDGKLHGPFKVVDTSLKYIYECQTTCLTAKGAFWSDNWNYQSKNDLLMTFMPENVPLDVIVALAKSKKLVIGKEI